MFISIALFVLGLVLTVKGGEWFVESSVAIAKKTKIPSVIIGATLVSVATTLPELLVSVIASANQSFDLAVGNAVGTMICNIALILGVVFVCYATVAKKQLYTKKSVFLVFITLVLVICSIDLVIAWWESLIMIALFTLFIVLNVKQAKSTTYYINSFVQDEKPFKGWRVSLMFVFGASAIAVGAMLLVEYGSILATMIGISEYIVGVTMVAVGTSLPELVTAIQSIKTKNVDLTIGNIIGANVINATLLVGLSGLVSGSSGLPITITTLAISLPVLLLSTLVVVLPILLKGKTYRLQGVALLTIYVGYILTIISI